MSHRYAHSESDTDSSVDASENAYCVFLHIVEGIGLSIREGNGDCGDRYKDKILLKATLNGVQFDVEGQNTETTTIFNSNCIWECELGDIKRMKTDNRPVKLEVYIKYGRSDHSPRKTIGTLLLPIRGVQTVSSPRHVQLKMHWHKLGTLHSEWRKIKPEIYLLLVVTKKTLIENGQFEKFIGKKKIANDAPVPESSETAHMLQSQSNVYVQLIEQLGVIQVGNNPDTDCDIFCLTLTFKQVQDVKNVLQPRGYPCLATSFMFHYEFLGSVANKELCVNPSDIYPVNEKILVNFKSSIKSLRIYFQRIFYIPISICLNGKTLATYRFNFFNLMPENHKYFDFNNIWIKNGNFSIDQVHQNISPSAVRPSVDFIFSIKLTSTYSKQTNCEETATNNLPCETYDRNAQIAEYLRDVELARPELYEDIEKYENDPMMNNIDAYTKKYEKAISETFEYGGSCDPKLDEMSRMSEYDNESVREPDPIIANTVTIHLPKEVGTISIDTAEKSNIICIEPESKVNTSRTNQLQTIAINTDPIDIEAIATAEANTEEIAFKIVQELEAWKTQQMDHFICQLRRKEAMYLTNLDNYWEKQRSALQSRLEAKITKCEELNTKLEKAHVDINSYALRAKDGIKIADLVKRDIENCYARKFESLDREMQRLKVEIEQRTDVFEQQSKDLQTDNMKLEEEKTEQKMRIEQLEHHILAIENTHLSADQLKDVLNDMRTQSDKFIEVEKTKNYYKDQWIKSTEQVHKLKLSIVKHREKCMHEKKISCMSICIDEILNADDLSHSDSEMKLSILSSSSDTSSSAIDVDEDKQ